MLTPRSLSNEVLKRAFHAGNGELGMRPEDVNAFLEACGKDHLAIACLEAWLVDHRAAFEGDPLPTPGEWCGLIPASGSNDPMVFSVDIEGPEPSEPWHAFVRRSIGEARAALSGFKPEAEISAKWLPFLRFNFTLEAEHA